MKLINRLILMLATLLMSQAVLAHPGLHGNLSTWEQISHFLSSPYHLLGALLIGVIISALVLWHALRGR